MVEQLVGLTGVDRRPLHLRPFYIYIHTHLPAQRRSTPLTHPSRNPQPATSTTTNKENIDQNCSLLAAVEREREREKARVPSPRRPSWCSGADAALMVQRATRAVGRRCSARSCCCAKNRTGRKEDGRGEGGCCGGFVAPSCTPAWLQARRDGSAVVLPRRTALRTAQHWH